jgi:hypothetical protein
MYSPASASPRYLIPTGFTWCVHILSPNNPIRGNSLNSITDIEGYFKVLKEPAKRAVERFKISINGLLNGQTSPLHQSVRFLTTLYIPIAASAMPVPRIMYPAVSRLLRHPRGQNDSRVRKTIGCNALACKITINSLNQMWSFQHKPL